MKRKLNKKITTIPRINMPWSVRDVEIDEVLKAIKTGRYMNDDMRSSTVKIQGLTDGDELRKQKSLLLPVALYNGTFSYKNNAHLTAYSSFTAMDFDNFESEDGLCAVRRRLVITPCVYAVYRTPSGKGLKAIVAHDNEDPLFHDELYGQLLRKFETPEIDNNVQDLARGNYMCYDPNLWMNNDCIPYHFEHNPNYVTLTTRSTQHSSTGELDMDSLRAMTNGCAVQGGKSDRSIISILDSYWRKDWHRWMVGNRANSVFREASELCLCGVNIDNALGYLMDAYIPVGLGVDVIIYQAARGYQNNIDEYGIRRSKFDGYGKSGR